MAVEAWERVCLGEPWWEPYSSSEVDVQSEPCCRRRVSRVSELVPEARTEQSSIQHPRLPPGFPARAGSGRVSRPAAGAPAPRSPLAEAPADPPPAQRHMPGRAAGCVQGPSQSSPGWRLVSSGHRPYSVWGVGLCPPDGNQCPWRQRSGAHRHPAAAAAKSLQSCLTLCDPIDGSPPGSPIPGILQARTLEWVAISFSNA